MEKSTIISICTSLLLLITILFDGKLKKEKKKFSIKQELNLNILGVIVVVIILTLSILTPLASSIEKKTIDENYKRDTIRLTRLINILEARKKEDSIRIEDLRSLSRLNISKTDSINRNIIQVAADESRRSIDAIEQNKQNIYLNFKVELLDNYLTILSGFDSTNLMGFINTNSFTNAKFNNQQMIAITNISPMNFLTIQNLKSFSDLMNMINDYSNQCVNIKSGPVKKSNIEAIIRCLKQLKNPLAVEYLITSKLPNFREYVNYRNSMSISYFQIDSLDRVLRNKFNLK